jgi:hypothetical protein
MGFLKCSFLFFMLLSNKVRVLVWEMPGKSLKSNKSVIALSSSTVGERIMHLDANYKEAFIDQGSSNTGHRARISSSRDGYSGKIIGELKVNHTM